MTTEELLYIIKSMKLIAGLIESDYSRGQYNALETLQSTIEKRLPELK